MQQVGVEAEPAALRVRIEATQIMVGVSARDEGIARGASCPVMKNMLNCSDGEVYDGAILRVLAERCQKRAHVLGDLVQLI